MGVGHLANGDGPAMLPNECADDLKRRCRDGAGKITVGAVQLHVVVGAGDRQRDVIAAPLPGQ